MDRHCAVCKSCHIWVRITHWLVFYQLILLLCTLTHNSLVLTIASDRASSCYSKSGCWLAMPLSALTHIMQICHNFDVVNLPRYHAGFTPMLFQWSYSHMVHFSLRIHCNFFTVLFFHSRPLFIA